jgi:hypothetical protein
MLSLHSNRTEQDTSKLSTSTMRDPCEIPAVNKAFGNPQVNVSNGTELTVDGVQYFLVPTGEVVQSSTFSLHGF